MYTRILPQGTEEDQKQLELAHRNGAGSMREAYLKARIDEEYGCYREEDDDCNNAQNWGKSGY